MLRRVFVDFIFLSCRGNEKLKNSTEINKLIFCIKLSENGAKLSKIDTSQRRACIIDNTNYQIMQDILNDH